MAEGKDIRFKISDKLPEFHFDLLDLLLPSPEEMARARGIPLDVAKEIWQASKARRKFYKNNPDLCMMESVLDAIKRHTGISEGALLKNYAPGLRQDVQKALRELEAKGHIRGVHSRGASRYFFKKEMVIKRPHLSLPHIW